MRRVSKRPRISCAQKRQSPESENSTCSSPSVTSPEYISSGAENEHSESFESPECTYVVAFTSSQPDFHRAPPSCLPLKAARTRTSTLRGDCQNPWPQHVRKDSVQRNVFDQLCSMPSSYNLIQDGSETLDRGMRWQIVAWIGDVCRTFQLTEFTFSLSVNYLDRLLATHDIALDEIQMLASCSILLAAKINEVRPRLFHDMAVVCGHESAGFLVELEKKVLNLLDYQLCMQTPHGVVDWLTMRALHGIDTNERAKYVVRYARFVLSCGLHELLVARCPPASVAVAAVFISFSVAHLSNKTLAEWTYLPEIAPAVAHSVLACRSMVSKTQENGAFLAAWREEADAFENASSEITALLENSLPTPEDFDTDSESSSPPKRKKITLKKRIAVHVDSSCHAMKSSRHDTAPRHGTRVHVRRSAKVVW